MAVVAGGDLQPDYGSLHRPCLSVCHPPVEDTVTYLRGLYGKKNPWWAKLLWWYPSLLLFPVVFYCLTEAIFTFVGIAFTTTAYIVAAIVLIAIPALAKAVQYLVPEKDLRLEIHFLVSLFVCILGLLTTVNGKTLHLGTAHYRKRQNSLCRRRRARQLERRDACPFALRYPIHRRLCMEPNQVSANPTMERTENEKTLLTIHY